MNTTMPTVVGIYTLHIDGYSLLLGHKHILLTRLRVSYTFLPCLSLSLTLCREPYYRYPEPVLPKPCFHSLVWHFNNITLNFHGYRSSFHLLLVLMQKFVPIQHTTSALSAIASGHNY
jgi:hypothetical protein